MEIFLIILGSILGYFAGSICSAIIVCQMCNLPDPRTEGSLNPGATNVMRIAGKKYGLIVLIADACKGLIPVLIIKILGGNDLVLGITCLAAVLGHMYPIFFQFKGGKGVATAIGGLLAMHLFLGVIVIAIWILILYFTQYVSLASLISLLCAPIVSISVLRSLDAIVPLTFITIMVVYQHRANINRLIDGTEHKTKWLK